MKTRNYLIVGWLTIIASILFLYFFKYDFFQRKLALVFSSSPLIAYTLYLVLGCVRGLTLMPTTSLIIAGLLFFSPLPLFILTIAGVMVSSASVYYFSGFLRLDDFFERTYEKRISRIKFALEKHELPIIVAWSFFPLAPTDLMCYLCGALNINFKKFMLGIFIGEGACCAIYIFGGGLLLQTLRMIR